MSAAERLDLKELKNAQEATRPPAASRERLERALLVLRKLADIDPASALASKAGAMREQLPVLDEILANLAYGGRHMMRDAQVFPELARELETLLPKSCENVRVVRALSMLFLRMPNDDADALQRAQAIVTARGERVAAAMTPEEIEELRSETPPDPAELEAWLNAQ